MKYIALVLASVLCTPALAVVNAFGFTSGMSRQAVETEVKVMNLGVGKMFGGTLTVQGQDNYHHAYLFNFCNDKLYEVSQQFPANFEQMASFVDSTLQKYGQPLIVSATGGMTSAGFVRPLNIYWKLDDSTYMRLMQLTLNYTVIYQWANSCVKVPT